MENPDTLQWSALEYEERERTPDWFWALGIIVVAASITSIIYENYFFAILIVIGGAMLGFFAIKKPQTIFYELNEKGLQVGNRLYLYTNIKSFWVQIEPKAILFIRSERGFMPILTIPIDETFAEKIHNILTTKNILEQEMKEHASEKIMDSLGF